jgi:hypothetical protein
MGFLEIFRNNAPKKTWIRIPDDHVVGTPSGALIEPDDAYFAVRMSEMYLQRTRKLWLKYYPLLHGFTKYQGEETHSLAGPGQLRDISDANLDRVAGFNYRLAGPIPFQGEDVDVLVGLYSVPGGDAAKALVDTLAALASIPTLGLGGADEVVVAVKTGVEKVLGLTETRLELGIRDSFFSGNPLKAGYHLGIDAEPTEVDVTRLWFDRGRLVKGAGPENAVPYADHDYMVIEIERRETRHDWRGFPELAPFEEKIAAVLSDGGLSQDQKKERLNRIWVDFRQAINASRNLISRDREQIAASVAKKIRDGFAATDLLESVGEASTRFDFLDVADALDRANEGAVREAKELLKDRKPF